MSKTYHAHWKILLSGEYMILDWAVGCWLSTCHGQTLEVKEITSNIPVIHRKAEEQWKIRFEWIYDKKNNIWTSSSSDDVARYLSHLFLFGIKNNKVLHSDNKSYEVKTHLSYPRNRWLWSSSTIIYLYAQLIEANPFDVHMHQHPSGSGYDIACAWASWPLLFEKTDKNPFLVTPINWKPSFHKNLYFVYSWKKQNTHESSVDERSSLIIEHEKIIAQHLGATPIQTTRFADNDSIVVKSLWWWGWDFLLVTWKWEKSDLIKYMNEKHITHIFTWDEFIL